MGHGRTLTVASDGRATAGAGSSGAFGRSRRGGPGTGGVAIAGRAVERGDRAGAAGAGRYGAGLALPVRQRWCRGAHGAATHGPAGIEGCDGAGLRRGGPGRTQRRGLDLAAAQSRDPAPHRREHLDRAAQPFAAPKRGYAWRRPRHTLKGRQDRAAVARSGVRLRLLKQQARAGDIHLLFADEAEALTHPYLAHLWAKRGADLRIEAPGQAKRRALLGALDFAASRLLIETGTTKRSSDFIGLLARLDRDYAPPPGRIGRPVVLVLDNGPIHTSKLTTKALAERAWLTIEWLPKYAPELNDIERSWRDLKRHHLANRTFRSADDLDQAIHRAVTAMNQACTDHLWANLQRAA
jgi:transposase